MKPKNTTQPTSPKGSVDTKTLVSLALFSALAFAVTLVFRLPVQFLTFDLKDAVITLAAYIYGPLSGILVALVSSTLELLISDTGLYGFIMNFVSSAAFAGSAAWIYRYRRSFGGAVLSLFSAVVIMVGVMMGMNLLITPYFMMTTVAVVRSLLLPLLLPFNAAKGLVNAALVCLFYKPLIRALRRIRVLPPAKEPAGSHRRQSFVMLAISFGTLALGVLIFVLLTKG